MVTTTDFVFDSILVQVHLLICLKLPPVTIPMTTGQAQQKWWLNWHLIRFDLMEKKGWKRMKRRPRGRLKERCQWAISDSDEAIVPFVGDVRSVWPIYPWPLFGSSSFVISGNSYLPLMKYFMAQKPTLLGCFSSSTFLMPSLYSIHPSISSFMLSCKEFFWCLLLGSFSSIFNFCQIFLTPNCDFSDTRM